MCAFWEGLECLRVCAARPLIAERNYLSIIQYGSSWGSRSGFASLIMTLRPFPLASSKNDFFITDFDQPFDQQFLRYILLKCSIAWLYFKVQFRRTIYWLQYFNKDQIGWDSNKPLPCSMVRRHSIGKKIYTRILFAKSYWKWNMIKIQYQLIFNAKNGPYDISESYVILIFDDINETKSHREVTGDLFILLWKGTVAW